MNYRSEIRSNRKREGIISAISAGFFFMLVGTIFLITPNLFDKVQAFFRDFELIRVPNTGIVFPGPTAPWSHSTVFLAIYQFSLIWGLFQIAILMLRIFIHSPLNKKAETVSNFVFWVGSSVLISSYLNNTTTTAMWFIYWSTIIMLCGASLIIRAIILAVGERARIITF